MWTDVILSLPGLCPDFINQVQVGAEFIHLKSEFYQASLGQVLGLHPEFIKKAGFDPFIAAISPPYVR